MRSYRVSPHLTDKNLENIYHLIARGLANRLPSPEELESVRRENVSMWEEDEQREIARIQEMKALHPESRPPMKILVKRAADLEKEFFSPIELFFPKYVIGRYHVVFDRKNADGKNPADLARDFELNSLSTYYEQQMDYYVSRRRLVQALNENLVREIGDYL